MKKVKELNNGWRLPTNKEWNLLAWEFGEKDDVLDSETLMDNLNLELKGYMGGDDSLLRAGVGGSYWSSTAYPGSTTQAYALDFNTGNVLPSNRDARYDGFSARLVNDIKE